MNKATLIHTAGKVPGLSRLLRWAASRFPEGSVVPVRSGFAQGMLWKRFHRYVNGYWLGQYEMEIQRAVVRLLSPGDTFLDLGANAGFFSLIAARRIGTMGKCISVDPDPANCENIRTLIELNRIPNWTVVQKAVMDIPGRLKFAGRVAGDPQARVLTEGEVRAGSLEVEATMVDDICREFGRPSLIKMDIEGAEVNALQGATQTLSEGRPTWLIELHGAPVAERARLILERAGYRMETVGGEAMPPGELDHHVVAVPV